MSWHPTKLSEFLTERDGRIKYENANQLGLQRIKKIDFSGNIHLDAETDTKTDMIRVRSGDLVISGINAAKGAIAVYAEDDDVLATIHYSSYEFNSDRISVDFLKWFFKSPEFSDLLREQIPGGIKTELKPKHILPLQVKLPKLSEQITVAERLNRFRLEQLKLEHEITHQQSLLAKLKQAILQEAIAGKLTADWRAAHPDVEPASQLLRRIQAEKAHLIAAKKLRPEKPLPKITPAEIPFEIPQGWEWCRLGQAIRLMNGASFKSGDFRKGEGVKCIKITNAGVGEFIETDDTLPISFAKSYAKYQVCSGDLILALTRPYIATGLKISRCPESYDGAMLNQRVAAIRPIEELLNSDYALLFLGSDFVLRGYQAEFDSKGQQPNLKSEHVTHLRLALPPLAEQAAIVARVEALMEHCRALAAEIAHTRTHAAHLLQAVLKEAFAPASTNG